MRALNMQSLTNDIERGWPGVTIYGKGDAAHAAGVSGHNEDDTPGVRAELQDSDTKKEHRAIDVMVRGPFTRADADKLVARMLADPEARKRLYYIIWYGYIWSRSHGWSKRRYTGSDQHKDHVHFSGWADDDDNTKNWPAAGGGRSSGGVNDLFCNQGDNGEDVGALQVKLKNLGFYTGEIDEDYGPKTSAALKTACLKASPTTKADGTSYDKYTSYYVEMLMIAKYGAGSINLQPLLDRLNKLEKAVAGIVIPTQPAPGLPGSGTLTIKGGTLEIGPA